MVRLGGGGTFPPLQSASPLNIHFFLHPSCFGSKKFWAQKICINFLAELDLSKIQAHTGTHTNQLAITFTVEICQCY